MSDDFCRCGHVWDGHNPNCEACGCSAIKRKATSNCKYCDERPPISSPEANELHEIKHLLEILVLRTAPDAKKNIRVR